MTRRSERWPDTYAAEIVLVASIAVIAGWCIYKSEGDFGEFFGRFVVLSGLLGVLLVFTVWEKRSRHRAYEKGWKRICHVLDGEHSHDGVLLSGAWKGRPFEALANAYMPGPNTGMVLDYRVSMPVEQAGTAWKAERARTGSRGADVWTLSAGGAEGRLVEAGLLEAIEDAERRAVHIRPDIRLSFSPKTSKVAYEDGSGEPSCAPDLVVHLDLVRRAVDAHAEAMVAERPS